MAPKLVSRSGHGLTVFFLNGAENASGGACLIRVDECVRRPSDLVQSGVIVFFFIQSRNVESAGPLYFHLARVHAKLFGTRYTS